MIISTLQELRLFFPSNAIDDIGAIQGFIHSSESDFLREKLGAPLYKALVDYYISDVQSIPDDYIEKIQSFKPLNAFAALLYLCQRVVAFDALGRAVSVQAISVNSAGVNVASAEDYKAADQTLIQEYKKSCVKESHVAVNELLVQLEEWTRTTDTEVPDDEEETDEQQIVRLWRESRYFFLAANLIIPSATVLQEYMDIYGSREKFIHLLPDLRYIQEDVLAPIFGDEFVDYIVKLSVEGAPSGKAAYITHNMRKVAARHLEARILKEGDARKQTAYDEAIKLTTRLSAFLKRHQKDMDEPMHEAFSSSPLYVADTPETTKSTQERWQNNAEGAHMFVTPPIY